MLEAQLQTAENRGACQEEKVKQLATNLKQMIQIFSLEKQVERMRNNLLQK